MVTVKDLLVNEELMNGIVEDLEDFSEDTPVSYEVWAIGYAEDGATTDAEMLLSTFDDPDMAVNYAKAVTLADIVNIAADDGCVVGDNVHHISIEVETVVPDGEEEDGVMNIGTIYKKTVEIFEELPEYISLSADDYELLENGDIQIPCGILKDYNKNDHFTAVFEDNGISQPMIYRIVSKTTSGCYICEFV